MVASIFVMFTSAWLLSYIYRVFGRPWLLKQLGVPHLSCRLDFMAPYIN